MPKRAGSVMTMSGIGNSLPVLGLASNPLAPSLAFKEDRSTR